MNERLAISYCRKSIVVKGKTDEESVGYQKQAIKEYAVRKAITIVKEFSDVGYSGKNTNRPELNEMIDYLRNEKGKIEELIIYSIDRFGRDVLDNISQILEILQLVKRVYFVAQAMASDSENFTFMFLAYTAAADDERVRILTRCAGGRREKVLNRKSFDGNYYPLGLIKDEGTEALIPRLSLGMSEYEKSLEIIQLQYIFCLYLYNYSLRNIARILNEKFGKTRRGYPGLINL